MRTYSNFVSASARSMLDRLIQQPGPEEYRELMTDLGAELAGDIDATLGKLDSMLLICTNEDADFLAKGVLEELERRGFRHIALACFWNERKRINSNLDVAPIVRSYVEPTGQVDVFVVVKSIISSACTIRTNISELVYDKNPRRILVVSPVILAGATAKLESEFDEQIARKFEYYWLAEDDESRNDGEVVPGIGGSVYELLGIGTNATKNRYVPKLVTARREMAKVHI